MHGGAVGARQPVKTDRRFIPAVHLHAFHIIQQLAAVQHRDRVAKAERFGVSRVLLMCGFTTNLDLEVKIDEFEIK